MLAAPDYIRVTRMQHTKSTHFAVAFGANTKLRFNIDVLNECRTLIHSNRKVFGRSNKVYATFQDQNFRSNFVL